MSELSANLADVIQDRASFSTDTVLLLPSGAGITAEVERNLDPFTLPEEYMNDPREKIRLHVTKFNEAAQVTVGQLISVPLNGVAGKFKVVGGYATYGALQSKFLCIQQISLDVT